MKRKRAAARAALFLSIPVRSLGKRLGKGVGDGLQSSRQRGGQRPEGGDQNTTVDGKNVGFAVENVGVLARNDFLEANPAAHTAYADAEAAARVYNHLMFGDR